MLKKILDNLGYAGFLALCGGYFYYSVNNVWDWKVQAAIYGGAVLIVTSLVVNFPRIRAGLAGRTGRYGSLALLTLLMVVGILVLINFLNFRHHQRFDLTENQLYSLSEQSQKVVRGLQQPVRILGFFQDEIESRRFSGLMEQYRYVSPRVEFEVIDPQRDPGRVAEYQIERQGQVVVTHGERRENVEQFSEEKITNAIIRTTRDAVKTVYFLQGHGERDINDTAAEGYSTVREELVKQNYQVMTHNLAQEAALPDDATMLVSAGPQVNFFPTEVELIEQFLSRGGKFLLLVDPQNNFSMADFLASYGLALGEDVIVDSSGLGRLFGLGAAAPLVGEYADHPVTREMEGVMTFFPLSQSVETIDSALGYQTTALLSTSSRSWGEKGLAQGQVEFNEGVDQPGPRHVAVAATLDVNVPAEPPAAENLPAAAADSDDRDDSDDLDEWDESDASQTQAHFILFGDSDFASNAYFKNSANGDLFLNTVNWLAEEEDLISIRPRAPQNRTVTMTAAESKMIFWATVILLPLITLIFGISLWYQRR